jgi:HEAT repeat protein
VFAAIADQNLTQYENVVLALLQSPTASVREAAIRTLGVIGTIQSYEPLYALYLENSNDAVVSEALSRLHMPEADANLLKAAKDRGTPAAQVAAFQLLALRNTDGVTSVANELAQAGNSEEVRKAAFRAMESIGDGESIRVLLNIIVTQDSLMRAAQGSLKKVSNNIGAAEFQWTEYYLPALNSAVSDDARKGVLAILDGVSCEPAAQYLQKLIRTDSPLRSDAIKSLSRWADISAAEVWASIYNSEGLLSDADQAAALRGLKRLFSQDRIAGESRDKVRLAAELIKGASSAKLKEAIVSSYEGRKLDRHTAKELKTSFKPLLDDPDVGLQVQALLK